MKKLNSDSFGVFMVFEDSDEVVGVEWVVGERE